MPVVEALKCFWILLLPLLGRAGRKSGMVTVMRADNLDLIHPHIAIALSQGTTAERGHGNRAEERHHEAFHGRAAK